MPVAFGAVQIFPLFSAKIYYRSVRVVPLHTLPPMYAYLEYMSNALFLFFIVFNRKSLLFELCDHL